LNARRPTINPALKRWAIIGLNPGAIQQRAQDFFGFEELAGDFVAPAGVAAFVG
jgi:hypothetical protein